MERKITRYLTAMAVLIAALLFVRTETKAYAEDGITRVYGTETGVEWGAETFKEGDLYYYVAKAPSGGKRGQLYVGGCDDSLKNVKIPVKVRYRSKDYDVLGVNDEAFRGKQIKSVEIADGVGLISAHAFYGCSELVKVKLGTGIKKISTGAFSSCEKLETINLPNTVTSIGVDCFVSCKSLKSIKLPSNLTVIPDCAFSGCESIKSIKLPAKVKTIGEAAFRGCRSLREVKFSKALTSIGKAAFSECSSLKRVVFTKNIKKLGEDAFSECSSLGSVKMNKKCTVVPANCFNHCTSLKTVTLSSKVKSIGDLAFFSCTLLEKVKGSNLKLKTIGVAAFQVTPKLRSISLKAVEKIDGGAFLGSGLREAEFGDGLKSIGESAFRRSHLRSIELPGSVKEIGKEAFRDCYWLESATIGQGVAGLSESMFKECYLLKAISIPSSVHYIGEFAFDLTRWLADKLGMKTKESYASEDGDESYMSYSFDYFENGSNDYSARPDYLMVNDVCIWVDKFEKIEHEWGWESKFLETVTFPSGAKTLCGTFSFERDNLKVIIPEGVEVVDGSFVSGDYGDEIKIVFPSTLKELNWRMIGNRLGSLVLPENLESIGDDVFHCYPLENLRSVTFTGKKLKRIGDRAFLETKIEKIVLPEGLEEIGEFAFCRSELASVNFPSTLRSVGECAFYKTKIKEIDLPSGLTDIGESAFAFSKIETEKLTLPKALKNMGGFAFEGTAIKTLVLPDNFEIKSDPLNDRYAEFIVKKNSKAHKALLAYIKEKRENDWKVRTR
ncbi:MAG: leucine-rich repeat domain-containing protein [Lachnospiraceae bacterium]|nr:leucine-rich repeat domain-containing protein [Lachnospiraceae bacterium]